MTRAFISLPRFSEVIVILNLLLFLYTLTWSYVFSYSIYFYFRWFSLQKAVIMHIILWDILLWRLTYIIVLWYYITILWIYYLWLICFLVAGLWLVSRTWLFSMVLPCTFLDMPPRMCAQVFWTELMVFVPMLCDLSSCLYLRVIQSLNIYWAPMCSRCWGNKGRENSSSYSVNGEDRKNTEK